MKHFLSVMFLSLLALAPAAMAQRWEVGVGGGGSFYTSQTIQNPLGNVNAGLSDGYAVSAWLDNNIGNFFGGELRYDYENPNLQLSSGGTKASFGAHTNAIHYDFLVHFAPTEARIRPFLAAGAGIKTYTGAGTEQAFQPLSNIALLTKGDDITALVSVGGGIKFLVAKSVILRLEAHDYLTPFPTNVIAPALGSKAGGWLSDFVVEAGLSFAF
jgi:hypothetical protein